MAIHLPDTRKESEEMLVKGQIIPPKNNVKTSDRYFELVGGPFSLGMPVCLTCICGFLCY